VGTLEVWREKSDGGAVRSGSSAGALPGPETLCSQPRVLEPVCSLGGNRDDRKSPALRVSDE